MGECKLSNSADGWKQSYGVRVGRDTADTTDLVFTKVATSEFQLYPNEAAYLRDLLLAADIPGHPVEDDRYEAICGSLGFHPETELADVIEAIQSVRSEARNYPNYQFRIEELTGQVRRLRDALADSTTRCSCDAMYPCNKCDADMVLVAETASKSTEGESVEYKLRSAILDAGFAVMQTSGKWSIVNVTDEAKRQMAVDEKHTARMINENIHLEMWKAEQQQALIKMSAILLDAGFEGNGVVEGLQWLADRVRALREMLEKA